MVIDGTPGTVRVHPSQKQAVEKLTRFCRDSSGPQRGEQIANLVIDPGGIIERGGDPAPEGRTIATSEAVGRDLDGSLGRVELVGDLRVGERIAGRPGSISRPRTGARKPDCSNSSRNCSKTCWSKVRRPIAARTAPRA